MAIKSDRLPIWLILALCLVLTRSVLSAEQNAACDETCHIKMKEDINDAELSALKDKVGFAKRDTLLDADKEKESLTHLNMRKDVIDLIVAQLADEVAERVMEQFPRSFAERIKEREEDEEYSKYLAELDVQERIERERKEKELKGCPSSLDDIVQAAIIDGGNCDTLQSWSNCTKTLLYYSKYADELDLGCDQPLIFEHGMTVFCEENRPISDYYDIRCYHRRLYHE